MKTRCPKCKTRYDIPPEALLEADGLARCFRCGTVFETVPEDAATQDVTYTIPVQTAVTLDAHSEVTKGDEPELEIQTAESVADTEAEPQHPPVSDEPSVPHQPESVADEETEPRTPPDDEAPESEPQSAEADPAEGPEPHTASLDEDRQSELSPSEGAAAVLPFAVPEDLEPLEPSPDVALDVVDTLYEKKSRRGLYYSLLAVLLVAGLGLQLAWQQRKELLAQYPILEPLCEHIACIPSVIHAPGKISVLQRDIKPTSNEPGSLTLSAKIRNDADIAQPLPDIQLSLVDNNSAVLIRRRLTAAEYMFPAPPKDKVLAPGEVVTITLDFQDPGHQASGFVIDFL